MPPTKRAAETKKGGEKRAKKKPSFVEWTNVAEIDPDIVVRKVRTQYGIRDYFTIKKNVDGKKQFFSFILPPMMCLPYSMTKFGSFPRLDKSMDDAKFNMGLVPGFQSQPPPTKKQYTPEEIEVIIEDGIAACQQIHDLAIKVALQCWNYCKNTPEELWKELKTKIKTNVIDNLEQQKERLLEELEATTDESKKRHLEEEIAKVITPEKIEEDCKNSFLRSVKLVFPKWVPWRKNARAIYAEDPEALTFTTKKTVWRWQKKKDMSKEQDVEEKKPIIDTVDKMRMWYGNSRMYERVPIYARDNSTGKWALMWDPNNLDNFPAEENDFVSAKCTMEVKTMGSGASIEIYISLALLSVYWIGPGPGPLNRNKPPDVSEESSIVGVTAPSSTTDAVLETLPLEK